MAVADERGSHALDGNRQDHPDDRASGMMPGWTKDLDLSAELILKELPLFSKLVFAKKSLCVAITIATLGAVSSQSISAQAVPATGNDQAARRIELTTAAEKGKKLRQAIDEKYKELNDANEIKAMGNGKNSIADVVARYIPIGTSFDEAEAILRAAGFVVGPRGKNPVLPNYFEVRAEIDQYAPTLFGKTSIAVSLQPVDPRNWNFVHRIDATIIRQSL